MGKAITTKVTRFAAAIMVTFAVLGGVGAGLASGTTDSHAAIKWGEEDVSATTTTGNGGNDHGDGQKGSTKTTCDKGKTTSKNDDKGKPSPKVQSKDNTTTKNHR